jgi:hypothetical protein
MKKFTFILIALLIVNLNSFACDCVRPSSDIELYWKHADEIFIGEVEEVTSNELYTKSGLNFTYYTVQIVESLKGHFVSKFRMRTFEKVGGGSCEYPFEMGKKYLIYADYSGHILKASICSRTAPLEEVDKSEIDTLKKLTEYYGKEYGYRIVAEKSETELELELAKREIQELNSTKNWLIGLLCALALFFVLSIFMIIRRTVK